MRSERYRSGTGSPSGNGYGPPRVSGLVVLLCAVLALVAVAVGLNSHGQSARTLDGGVRSVGTASSLVDVAGRLHARGCVLVVATEDLAYAPVPVETLPASLKWPVSDPNFQVLVTRGADRDSWAWVLARSGVARSISYVMPALAFDARVAEGRAAGFPGIATDGRSISANDEGYLRHISDGPIVTGEPTLLVVDASYFLSGTAQQLVDALDGLPHPPGAVVFYRAEDDPDVSDAARRALDDAVPAITAVVAP